MTPGDILNKTFQRGMNGYKADEVNAFLSEVASELKVLSQERADLQNKLEVLAEKLEEYRNDEESLRAALIGAQKLGDSVIKEARKKAETLLAEANHKADSIISESKRNIDAEAYALSKMRLEVAKFRTQVLNLYKKQVELINSIPYEDSGMTAAGIPTAGMPDAGKFAGKTGKAEDSAASGREDEVLMADASAIDSGDDLKLEYERISDEGEGAAPQRQSRFGNLRFGEKYDLKRDE